MSLGAYMGEMVSTNRKHDSFDSVDSGASNTSRAEEGQHQFDPFTEPRAGLPSFSLVCKGGPVSSREGDVTIGRYDTPGLDSNGGVAIKVLTQ